MKLLFAILLAIIHFNLCFCQSFQDTVFTNYFERNGIGWNAGDGTISMALPDGKTLWLFGDSHVDQGVDINNELPCFFNTRNSLMLQDESNEFTTFYDTTGTDIYSRQFTKTAGDSSITYWPAGGFVYGDIVYSFWEKYEIIGAWEFLFLGIVIAEIGLPNIDLLSITPLSDNTIEFGSAVVSDLDDGYHYIYGKKNIGGLNSRPAFVARCPIGEIYNNWEFFSEGNNWELDASNAISISDNVSNAYSVFKCDNKYFLLSQERNYASCNEGKDIYLFESDNPQGPFDNGQVIYTINEQFDSLNLLTYNAQAHPQFIENDELLVSFNVNKPCSGPCIDSTSSSTYNANIYRPKFIRFRLSSQCFAVSTENIKNEVFYKIYPNPVNQVLYISTNSATQNAIQYQIYNLMGARMDEGRFQNSIDISNLESGIYILKIISKGYEQAEMINKL